MINSGCRIYYGWWIVFGCFIMLFLFAGAGFYSFSIFIKPLEDGFGWSRSQISLAMTIYLIVNGAASPLIGYLTDKFGPQKVMTLFTAGFGITFLAVSLAESRLYFYLTYALLGIMSCGIGYVPVSSVLTRWFIKHRGTAIGISMSGIAMGGFVLAPLIELLNTTYSWRAAFIFLGILVWVVGLPVSRLLIKSHPGELGLLPDGEAKQEQISSDHSDEAPSLSGWSLIPAMKTRAFWAITASYVFSPVALMGVLQHQVPLITSVGVSPAAAAVALGFTAGLGGLGKLSLGKITELVPIQVAIIICFGLQAIGVFVLYIADSMMLVWAHVTIFGFAMGGNIVLLPIIIGKYFGLVSFGPIMGLLSFFQAIGAGAGAIISGLIYDFTGNYQIALALYLGMYFLAILSFLMAGCPRQYSADR